jgi:hypothetical protein
LGLWKHFSKKVEIYASIDHCKERAEYIRHGTDWGQVEANFMLAKQTPYVNIQINTVLSVFNYLTIDKFYQYLIDRGMYTSKDSTYTLYNMTTPDHLTCHILPPEYKSKGEESINKAISYMKSNGFIDKHIQQLEVAPAWAKHKDNWDEQKVKFKEEVKRLDTIRGESFINIFPEIANLFIPEQRIRARMAPV